MDIPPDLNLLNVLFDRRCCQQATDRRCRGLRLKRQKSLGIITAGPQQDVIDIVLIQREIAIDQLVLVVAEQATIGRITVFVRQFFDAIVKISNAAAAGLPNPGL